MTATGMDLFPASFFESFQTQPMGQSMGGMSGGISGISQAFENFDFPITQNYQSSADVPPWNSLIYVTEDPAAAGLVSPSLSSSSHHNQLQQYQQHQQYSPSISVSVSPPASSASPKSPIINLKREASVSDRNSNRNSTTTTTTAPITIRKVRGDNARVSKKKSTFSSSTAADSSPLSSTGSNSSKGSAGASKFFIVTPDSVFQHANKPNPFECFEEQHRQSQRGRKGPLANDTKESALEVRRQGACFCCHARKVKCDKERPCRNCKKLTMQVPQVICWRFQDFQRVLFPEFIRGHFRKDEMHKFVTDNIEAFTVGGQDKPCTVELFSGKRFSATLSIRAKFFTAKTNEVLRHWHMQVVRNAVDLQSRDAAPIGLDMTESGSGGGGGGSAQQQRDELRKKTREYIQAIVGEPAYAELVTESQRHTTLPRKVLRIVQDFAARCGSPMVKRALSIYAMHHVMSQQLCLTRQTIINLAATKLVPQNQTWVTPRVLNRQIKSVIDEMLIKEMTALFEHFSKSLKPKSRREWAPCLAAFLVLCLFMESVEAAADTFVISETEIGIRSGRGYASEWKRSFALGINQEIENLPFKQFAFQFHQIYQTHSRDSGTRSFNPLVDDLCLDEHRGEMGDGVDEMVDGLRDILRVDWGELDFLTMDPPLPNGGEHPYPMDVSFNYEGRLAAKFLLSFENEKYIFGF
ncbi:hypothetical protein B0T17DRAFT_534179 [Bombardia bombarda]|uniref:Zn(2)-C6 fungal-type domain-containing protein n=1 Tax=Bombardia bombarda TaxID=252184 RepID=A0AA39WTV3_9PEZI|nr:hypothetical protein B0T17DRAFT_534179 [Bombardia bombarda]